MNANEITANTNTEFIYHPDGPLLVVRFHGFQTTTDAAKDKRILNDTIKKKNIRLVLINQQHIKVLSAEMKAFIVNSAVEMIQHGIKKMAVVLPEDIFALAAVSKIHNDTKTTAIHIEQFASETEGIQWLRNESPH